MKISKLAAMAGVFTLATMGLVANPGIAGATALPSDTASSVVSTESETTVLAQESVEVQSCYDGGHGWTKTASSNYVPTGYPNGQWFTTRDNCNDINVKINSDRGMDMQVCFNPSSGSPYCQAHWERVTPWAWYVLATNVGPGTQYKLRFRSSYAASGQVAT